MQFIHDLKRSWYSCIIKIIYAIGIGEVLAIFNLAGPETVSNFGINVVSLISLVFSMMGEELLKFIPLMLLLRTFYKFTDNTKVSMILSVAIVLAVFGLMHYSPGENTLISVLVMQGLGSLFEMYGYIKTKNLFVPYIAHLLTDAVIFIMILLGPVWIVKNMFRMFLNLTCVSFKYSLNYITITKLFSFRKIEALL